MGDFRDLNVYKKGLDMVKDVYAISKKFPKAEMFGLTNQFRRAATFVVLNIAEGSGCGSPREFSRFLNYALRSKHKAVACVDIAEQLGYVSKDESAGLRAELEEISSMIVGLRRSVTGTK